MNLTRCGRGHFYDADQYASCPHCDGMGDDNVTQKIDRNEEDTPTVTLGGATETLSDAAKKASQSVVSASSDDDAVTIGIYSNQVSKNSVEPVVGWLVCTEGGNIGQDFRLKSGKNFIGRGSDMDVVIDKDNSVSRNKHAIILYEPKAHIFLVQPGESKELCYLNEKVVLAAEEIKLNDVLTVGDSKLMFFPCCNAAFNWEMTSVIKKDNKEEN